LASEEVAAAIETLGGLALSLSPPRRQWPHGEAFRAVRLCYDHLAGRLGVSLHAALVGRAWIAPAADGWAATAAGEAGLDGLGVDLAAARRARRFAATAWIGRSGSRTSPADSGGRSPPAACAAIGWAACRPKDRPTRSPAGACA
jgi:hypothetical protein